MMACRNLFLTSKLSKQLLSNRSSIFYRAMSTESDVLFEDVKGKGVITFNRPKALNALNLSMVEKLLPTLQKWEKEKSMVVVKGAGGKSFCAGGDVRAVTEAGLRGERYGYDFFKKEYIINGIIGTYGIPYIALIDGIVMGGGVGMSVHAPYRVATERTLFAMPETAIGLFPDVGGSHFLPRLGGKLGLYLALTGVRLRGADVLKAGIATHYVDSSNLENVEKALLDCSNVQDIDKVLKGFSVVDNNEFSLKSVMEKINTCFNGSTVEQICSNLEKDGSSWAQETLKLLNHMSPTSLKITLEQLNMGSKMNLLECLQMEYRMAVNCLNNKDFYEGVRALLIDKDKSPKWNPATISEVSDKLVQSHFSKLPEDEELKHKL
ncbi:PREDICTED: 3-hydroxyisobutyryl-CoA hydrolase, mitochondrial-like [Nicrophorus vespilloides]|uniref:3-hydroxyisobutyryl-CoA hydrolase, mitochondrial n=1 Tax=Nicrophorus vespilloides TaxID=110193 RepID=A0ABM1MI76_NICVS|nr:PREDICTED: 3-hydroxyisobutyryl-CoA hydrolase, mitochondrial-like [Nicrophorus vespilloides]